MEAGFKLSIFLCFHQSVTLPELPAVVVFKDGTYFTYDGKYCVCINSCLGFLQLVLHIGGL